MKAHFPNHKSSAPKTIALFLGVATLMVDERQRDEDGAIPNPPLPHLCLVLFVAVPRGRARAASYPSADEAPRRPQPSPQRRKPPSRAGADIPGT